MISYNLYPSLLDAWEGYKNSDKVWETYWGFSENPPHTPELFHEQQYQSLIDKINRVPFESEAADIGTAFNEVVDCIIDSRKSDTVSVERVYSETSAVVALEATYKEQVFVYDIGMIRHFTDMYKGALTQQFVDGVLPTKHGDVRLYGYIDELMPLSVHDIKTTGRYGAFKFKDHFQHLVYPYCLMQMGNDITRFEYNICEIYKKATSDGVCVTPKGYYTEVYDFVPCRDIPILRERVEEFIDFLNDNRDKITDKKVFNQHEEQ